MTILTGAVAVALPARRSRCERRQARRCSATCPDSAPPCARRHALRLKARSSIRPVLRRAAEQRRRTADGVVRNVPGYDQHRTAGGHRRSASRRGAHRAAVRDDERPARDDLLRGRFTLLNPAWEQLLGWSRERSSKRARSPSSCIPTTSSRRSRCCTPAAGRSAELESFTNRYRHRDGSWRWLLWSARRDGDTWYAAAKDVTDRMWLERQALHDPLTRLPNRLLLMDRACQALARLHRSSGVVAMLFIDLDKFKAVNDNLGHDVGDRLLVLVSERLADLMRDSDTVARLGGDEFVILAEDIDERGRGARARRSACSTRSRRRSRSAQPKSRCSPASACRSRTRPTPTPRRCCARRTSRCTARRAPAAGAWSCSTSACASEMSTQARASKGGCATRCPQQRAAARLPADRAARRRAGRRRRGARALAPHRRRAQQRRGAAARDVPAARRGQRADRADRQLGAAHGLRAGREAGGATASRSPSRSTSRHAS